LATLATEAIPGVTVRLEQLIGRPTLFNLQQTGSFATSSREAVRATLGLDDHDWDRLEEEFADVERRLTERRTQLSLAYPEWFAVERETSVLLYGLTRLLKPRCILETGVADGTSSFVFLAALEKNGQGQLHSVDISQDVGALVEATTRWHLHIYDVDTIDEQLAALCMSGAPIDIFFHDSAHGYLSQLFEYAAFAANASNGALLISDDVDWSYAFDGFCRRRGVRPSYLFDARKVTGMVRL
jgi:predicted O-methyltransferase YrrM